ncbi:hypothetical protein [Streptomyces sp. CBMA152]|uniref:hypothetical protein n=1 Tax=Streptomyces sp. CBMA152 TaxID=1896312 RepID=UPI001CB70178|nr:hypothetical protein [Streptomyces sp. CBMA152]
MQGAGASAPVPRALVLCGAAGVGKSALAVRVAREAAEELGVPACWVPVGGLVPEAEVVRLRLTSLFGGAAVLVLDDVPSREWGAEFLSLLHPGIPVTVVITTRDESWWEGHERPHRHAVGFVKAGSEAGTERTRRLNELPIGARALLDVLRMYPAPEFSLKTARELMPHAVLARNSDADEAVAELVRAGLVEPVREGLHVLHSVVRDRPPNEGQLSGPGRATLDTAYRAMNQRLLSLPAGSLDEYVNAAVRSPLARRLLLERLSRLLVMRGEHHELAALAHAARGEPVVLEDLRVPLAVSARDTGDPLAALDRLGEDSDPESLVVQAVTLRQLGQLELAVARLDLMDSADTSRAMQYQRAALTARGAVLIDLGRADEADAALRMARTAHIMANDHHGAAWNDLHAARLHLLRGDAARCVMVLGSVSRTFSKVDDARGRAWVATLQLRANHLSDERATLLRHQWDEAIALHRAAGDARGVAWTQYWLALVFADRANMHRAKLILTTARLGFRHVKDSLGEAWAEHHLGVLTRDPEQAVAHLTAAARLFSECPCPHGAAWTELELALWAQEGHLDRYTEDGLTLVRTAQRYFEEIGDRSGWLWAEYIGYPPPEGSGPAALRALCDAKYPAHLTARTRLAAHEGRGPGQPRAPRPLPRIARDTVTSGTWDRPVTLLKRLPPAPTHCQVRLTLLDDTQPHRIRLTLTPGPAHPWSTEATDTDTPWLQATATPLTPATLDPPTALVRPSRNPAHQAEFTFTPHCAGTHRVRFTITDERTGTVLQRVETEMDIPEALQNDNVSAPHPEHVRGV